MKLQIDTSEKAIRLLDSVSMGDLVETLKKLLPNKEWKEFYVQYAGEVHWKDIIYVPLKNPEPIYPWYTTTENTLTNGIFNVETTNISD